MSAWGSILGTYRVLNKIGEGGMGTVYLAEHTLLGRKAAIKVLLPALSANEEVVRRFFNEARAVTQITDPGIVQIFDFGYHTDGSAFIVMELLDGEAMDKRLARIGKFGLIECLRLMRLICSSLGAAHARGIVHRDLKPENIFIVGDPAVTGGERAKILDFGIAKLSGEDAGTHKTRTGMLMGTPVYMSPEQCRGAGDIDHRSDIYTMACVMFTMLTGRPPFNEDTTGELIAAHLREPPPLAASRVPELPGIVDEILQRCLRKAPAERFQSMAELVDAIGAAEQVVYRSHVPTRAIDLSLSQQGPLLAPPMPPPMLPPPAPATLPPLAPTTLSGSAGQTAAGTTGVPGSTPRGRGRIAGFIAGVVAVGGAIAIVASLGGGGGGGGGTSPQIAPPETGSGRGVAAHAPTPTAAAAPTIDARLTIDAGPATAIAGPGAPPPVAPDAGVVVTDVPDVSTPTGAGASPPHRPKAGSNRPRQPKIGTDHASPTGSATAPRIDRGD
jgi:serine/threonine-protein kinase